MDHPTYDDLLAHLDDLRAAPADAGTIALVVRRPDVDEREVLDVGELDPTVGLVGDTWSARGSSRTEDGGPHPEMQLTMVNVRMARLLGATPEEWALAGDQLYVDLDLGVANLPVGARLRVGTAVVEVTAQPHTGCAKYARRYGRDAMRFVNSEDGRALRLRGMNARVVEAGTARPGDEIAKL